MIRKIIYSSLFSLTALVILSSFNQKPETVSAPEECASRVILANYTKTVIELVDSRDDDEFMQSHELGHYPRHYVGTFRSPEFLMFEIAMPDNHQGGTILIRDMITNSVIDSHQVEGGSASVYILNVDDPSCRGYYRIEYMP